MPRPLLRTPLLILMPVARNAGVRCVLRGATMQKGRGADRPVCCVAETTSIEVRYGSLTL